MSTATLSKFLPRKNAEDDSKYIKDPDNWGSPDISEFYFGAVTDPGGAASSWASLPVLKMRSKQAGGMGPTVEVSIVLFQSTTKHACAQGDFYFSQSEPIKHACCAHTPLAIYHLVDGNPRSTKVEHPLAFAASARGYVRPGPI